MHKLDTASPYSSHTLWYCPAHGKAMLCNNQFLLFVVLISTCIDVWLVPLLFVSVPAMCAVQARGKQLTGASEWFDSRGAAAGPGGETHGQEQQVPRGEQEEGQVGGQGHAQQEVGIQVRVVGESVEGK